MSERGIIFSAPMVRALLDGRKTQTRRLLNPQPEWTPEKVDGFTFSAGWTVEKLGLSRWRDSDEFRVELMPLVPHAIGDRLYVRETCAIVGAVDPGWVLYRANGYEAECERHGFDNPPPESEIRWRPSIHMPRWASRLTLMVTDVRVQRLQDIGSDDAKAEGVEHHPIARGWKNYQDQRCFVGAPETSFETLWNSLHDKPGTRWEDNPWLYALTFDVQHGNIDQVSA